LGIVTGGTGTPVAVELGIASTSTGTVAGQGGLVSVANATPSVFDTSTPGTTIFGWETPYTPAGGTSKPEGLEVNCTGCTVTNTAANPTTGGHPTTLVAGTANQIFAALGSANITVPGANNLLNITVTRPVVSLAAPNTTTNLQVSGAYNTGKARIAQINGANSQNYDTFGGTSYSFTRNAHGGDTDLNGVVNFADFQLNLLPNLNTSGKTWQTGDFNVDGNVDLTDFTMLASNFNRTVTPAPSADVGTTVPEPAVAGAFTLVAAVLASGRMRRRVGR
jgi:hypothetical protein